MIKINDKYSFKRSLDCWILRRHSKKSGFDTYHATLEQLSTKVLQDSAIDCETVTDVLESINKAKQELKEAIRGFHSH